MPPKPKRLPHPTQHHLKHSRQLLEDFLYQYLPLVSGLGSISRLNLFTWFNGKWGLSPTATGGIPYMVLEALRLQRQHLLNQKLSLKPLSLSLLSPPEDSLQPKALSFLQELNNQSHTAKINQLSLPWQEVLKQLQQQLQRQPATERNLLLLDPLDLSLPPLEELLPMLPKRLDVLLILPTAAIRQAGGLADKIPPHEAALSLAEELSSLIAPTQEEALEEEETTTVLLIKKLREGLTESSKRFIMHYAASDDQGPVTLFGLTPDSLMMEKMLLARHKLEQRALEQKQTGNQLGLFMGQATAGPSASTASQENILQLLAQQPEWNNQELYQALLLHELLPQEALPVLAELVNAGKLEVLDEKKKKLKSAGPLPVTQTAYKLPAPSRYFRLIQ